MAMYSAYFDESGHPDNGAFLVVAGCIADVEQWKHFEREWRAELAPLGTFVFHTVDFDARKGPFNRLSDDEADELFARLVGIICRRIEKTVVQAIPLDLYRIINEKYVFSELYGFPYPVAARHCLALVGDWASKHSIPQDEILSFFEDGAKHKGQIKWLSMRDGFQQPIFRQKAELVPLQSGDLIAWCHNLYLTSGGRIPRRYERAIDRMAKISNAWGLIDLRDPDRLPAIVGIQRRDPSMKYKSKIVRVRGEIRSLVQCWPKNEKEPSLQRKNLVLPPATILTAKEAKKAVAEYEESRGIIKT